MYGKGARKTSKPTAVGPTRQLPIVDDEVMLAIGRCCFSLEQLDISYNRDKDSGSDQEIGNSFVRIKQGGIPLELGL